MTQPTSQTVPISHESSAGEARRAAKKIATKLGFAPEACEEIALAITELATNLVKHARGGKLILTPVSIDGRIGLQIESQDNGPGITDVERAIADGFSTAGGLGAGLGTVNRLMDEFDIISERGRGTRVVCCKWIRQWTTSARRCPLAFGVATRPHLGNEQNGDAFVVKQWAESALVGVIDGLGHGQFAFRAAQAARQYVENHFELPLAQIFRGAGRACRATRGVVMALARFDWGQGRFSFASVGNIEVRVHPNSKPFHFILRRGIVGLNAPAAVVTEHPWTEEKLMVLHSDGLRTHWSWEDFPGLSSKPASVAAYEMLRALAKDNDDATVLVIGKAVL